MDIKDLIIIAGILFFVAIVAHGLWVARRSRLNGIRMDIKASDSGTSSGTREFSQELPNGGARVINQALQGESQPLIADKDGGPTTNQNRVSGSTSEPDTPLVAQRSDRAQRKTKVDEPPSMDDLFASASVDASQQAQSIHTGSSHGSVRQNGFLNTESEHENAELEAAVDSAEASDSRRAAPQLEELLILGIMAPPDEPFVGEELIAALRGQGLKFGDMGIFHRLSSDGEDRLFSVANALEPGTFDLSDLDALETPGLTFFMQLPVPGDALETLDDMILSARTVAAALGGNVKDDTMSALTGQTVEHMKQRIADYALKQLKALSDG